MGTGLKVGGRSPLQTGPDMTIGCIGWDTTRDEWLNSRRDGMGGSDIAAVLGFSAYRSPWDVWAEKTGTKHWADENSAAAELGIDLEPWLRGQAETIVGAPATETEWRTYRHEDHAWRMCSPDGIFADGRLLECKTAGLASGFGTPRGWDDGGLPLGYQCQARWSMHVMDAPAVEVVALVAGMGLQRRTVVRDVALEIDLVDQVTSWWTTHIIGGEEPPLGSGDAEAMQRLYPRTETELVDLSDTDAMEHWSAYRAAAAAEKSARSAKAAAAANLERLLGPAGRGEVDGQVLVTWTDRKGSVEWQRVVDELVDRTGADAPDIDAYRKPASRTLRVKDVT